MVYRVYGQVEGCEENENQTNEGGDKGEDAV